MNAATNAAAAAVNAVKGTSGGGSAASLNITVTDPVKQGERMRAYISYKINTKTIVRETGHIAT